METEVALCKLSDLPDGGMKSFEIMGFDVIVVRRGDQLYGLDAACTYRYAMLTDGNVDLDKMLIRCKDCNGSWDLTTGQPRGAPATFPLTSYQVTTVGDDVILTFTY